MKTPTIPQTVPELLRAAEALIDTRGWHQDDYVGPAGGLCAVGAVRVAAGVDLTEADECPVMPFPGVYVGAMACLAERIGGWDRRRPADAEVVAWNDQLSRTADEVRAALLAAAEAAESNTPAPVSTSGREEL